MGLFSRLTAPLRRMFGYDLVNPPRWFIDYVRGDDVYPADSGVTVNARTVLTYAPVWSGIQKICSIVSRHPPQVYERVTPRESQLRSEHPGSWAMRVPNDWMDSNVFLEILTAHAVLQGNGRAYIERDGRNNPLDLVPLLPDRTKTVVVNGKKWHTVTNPNTGETDKLPDADVLHICGFGYDGVQGYSLIEMAKNSFGLGLAAEKHANRHFNNNAVPSLVLEAPPGAFRNEQEAQEFLRKWNEYHQGLSQSNKTGLLREGIKASTLGMNGKDAEWIEQRKFQRQEAALWLCLEQILGDDSSVSYNSLEQKNLAFLVYCWERWLVKWEQQCNRKLLTGLQQRAGSHYFKFPVEKLLPVTMKERYECYQIGRAGEWLSANDVRFFENLPPIPDGDNYKNPAINPQKTGEQPPEKGSGKPTDANGTAAPDGDSTAESGANAREKLLILSRIKELVKVETQRAIDAAAKPMQFAAWLDKFYSASGFVPRISAVILDCGGNEALAETYAGESAIILREIHGNHATNGFAAAVQKETDTWGERAARLASLLYERKTK